MVDSLPSLTEPVRDDVSIYNNYEPRVWTEVTPRKLFSPYGEVAKEAAAEQDGRERRWRAR